MAERRGLIGELSQEKALALVALSSKSCRSETNCAGFSICMAARIDGVIVALYGKEWAGFAMGGTGLASLVGVFVYGTQSRRKERELKFQKVRKE